MWRLARRAALALLLLIAFLLVSVTAISAIPSNGRWVRIWDFPRLQVAGLLAFALFGVVVLAFRAQRALLWSLAGLLSLALVYQLHRLWPYTPAHPVQAPIASACPAPSRISTLVSNVLYTNRDADLLIAMVRRTRPDMVLLLETDDLWDRKLDALRPDYPHRVSHPRPDGHGLHLLSRYPLVAPEVRYLFDEYRPSVRSGVRLPSGSVVRFYGMHPAPPPLKDTARRDAGLLIVAQEIRAAGEDAIVAGDFNDVPWSRTTQLFSRVGGLFDPRVGRGFHSTFDTRSALLRWPLDHVFYTPCFQLLDFAVRDRIGSDHFPVYTSLCHAPGAGGRLPPLTAADRQAAERVIEAGRAQAGASQKAGAPRKRD